MPRNPRPNQIDMGGSMLSVQVAGSPENTHLTALIFVQTAQSGRWSVVGPSPRDISSKVIALDRDYS